MDYSFIWKIGIGIAILVAVWMGGRASKTVEIISSPSKVDTIWTPSKPIVKWLKADTIYKVPDSTQVKINSLTNNVDSLRNKIVELSQPYSTVMDSSNYYLYILSHPYEKVNKVQLDLRQPQITKTIYIPTPTTPWWTYPTISVALILGYVAGNK